MSIKGLYCHLANVLYDSCVRSFSILHGDCHLMLVKSFIDYLKLATASLEFCENVKVVPNILFKWLTLAKPHLYWRQSFSKVSLLLPSFLRLYQIYCSDGQMPLNLANCCQSFGKVTLLPPSFLRAII